MPVLGVVEPGARGAVQATHNRRIGVIGTLATIQPAGPTSRLYTPSTPALTVHSRACPSLVDFVERGEVEGPGVREEVRRYLAPLIKRGVDTLILGCTHYPLISGVIGEEAGDGVSLISSDEEVAREVEENLVRRGYLRGSVVPPSFRFMCSGDIKQAIGLGRSVSGPRWKRSKGCSCPCGEWAG